MGITNCSICPRHCSIERANGFCGAKTEPEVAAICIHRGEEPPITGPNGIVNIFFAHCNLQCIYCQNNNIADRSVPESMIHYRTIDEIADRVATLLPQSSGLVGFVTAAHYLHLVRPIIDAIHKHGSHPTIVYNSSGYETANAIKSLEGLVDIYLPDLKYMDSDIAAKYSHAKDYPEVAAAALLEMKRQVGSGLMTEDNDVAYRGMIVRHLVLPGAIDNSIKCLNWLADNMPLNIHVSLMSQYFPAVKGLPDQLNRQLTNEEYNTVAKHMENLGFFNGWTQQPSAATYYQPNFTQADNPFE